MTDILLYSFAIMVASLVGVLLLWHRIGDTIEKNIGYLLSFSAGVFLIITYQLSQETLEHAANLGFGLFWIGGGALFVWLLFRFIPSFHDHDHQHGIDARHILFGDALHNIGDGILLAASFSVGGALGVATAISVFVHELVQEVSEFFVLRGGGFSTQKALAVNFAISSTILIGALGAFFLLDVFEAAEAPLLGIAAGSFFVVVLHDLIPHSVRSAHSLKHYLGHAALFAAGIALMLGVNALAPHAHEDEDEEHEHYGESGEAARTEMDSEHIENAAPTHEVHEPHEEH